MMTSFPYLRGLELLCHGKGQLDNYFNRQPWFNHEHMLFHTPSTSTDKCTFSFLRMCLRAHVAYTEALFLGFLFF